VPPPAITIFEIASMSPPLAAALLAESSGSGESMDLDNTSAVFSRMSFIYTLCRYFVQPCTYEM